MRVGEHLAPIWQNAVVSLWVLGYGLTFVAVVSTLWGWHVVGWVSCAVLVISTIDERKGVRASLAGNLRRNDRWFATYLVVLTAVAVVVNIAWAGFWIAGLRGGAYVS
jgi:hypothetical protein